VIIYDLEKGFIFKQISSLVTIASPTDEIALRFYIEYDQCFIVDIFIKTFRKIFKLIFGPWPYFPTGMMEKYFGHPCGGVRMWVKIQWRTVAKSTFGISLEITSNLIPTRKIEIFWELQKGIILPVPFSNRGDVPKTHQAYYLIDLIRVIKIYAPKSLLYHRQNRIPISFRIRELLKNSEI